MTKQELEETTAELTECSQHLAETKEVLLKTESNLRKTRQDRDEQKYLVGEHVKSEKVLHEQAAQVCRKNFHICSIHPIRLYPDCLCWH